MLTRRTTSALVAVSVLVGMATATMAPASPAAISYDRTVLADRPVAYFDVDGSTARDLTGNGHRLTYHGSPGTTTLPNGAPAMTLDGENDYAEIADADDLSIGDGVLTVEAWVRVDDLDNERLDDGQYVHWLGKGDDEQQEYAFRLYNGDHDRSSRMSAYVFNPSGGYGYGSYFQDDLQAGRWMHVGAVFDARERQVTLYRDGVRRDSDDFESVRPRGGDAPLRIGTRQLSSFLEGSVAKVAVFDYDASEHFAAHVRKMRG